jgi:HK97 family phage prohead protease|nr:MAG TPA: prohead serine protease [Caudoviricetes sp.]
MGENKDTKKREIRFFAAKGQPRIREAGDSGAGSRIIEGYAIVFGVQSKLLVDWGEAYREVIEPGAVTQEDLARFDIKMTAWHNRERLLARSNRGSGTLTLTVDEFGVKYSFEAPKTPDGDTALELVRRGDLAGSSFIFWSDETTSVSYTKDPEGVIIRHVNRIDEIFDMTIASDPAYAQTNVTAREMDEATGREDSKDNEEEKDGIEEEECRKREQEIINIRTSARQEFYY